MPQAAPTVRWPRPQDGQGRITLLGTHHFHTPGNDEHTVDLDDPLSPERQEELVALRKRLQDGPFDNVAVEIPVGDQERLDEQYAATRNAAAFDSEAKHPDGPAPIRSEMVQIGFRVADTLALDSVHAVDSRPDFPDIDADWAIAEDPDSVPYPLHDAEEMVKCEQAMIRDSTYIEALRRQNQGDQLRQGQSLNIAAALSSSNDGYAGSTQIGYWYERNARIFENLARVTAPNEETLFVVGASHVLPLKQLAQAAPATCPRSPLSLLSPAEEARE